MDRPAESDAPRRDVRIFLASSSELREERELFPRLLAALQERSDLRRTVRLVPVRWETDGFGGDPEDINHAIARAVEFDRLDLVVVVVRNKIGSGTEGEFRRAAELWKVHWKPELLVYVRSPSPDADVARIREVEAFLESVIRTGIVPTRYDTIDRFAEMVTQHVPARIVDVRSRPEPAEPLALRRWFTASSLLGIVLSAATVALAQMVSYPSSGVSQATVLALLVAPVLLFASLGGTLFLYARLLRGLERAWRSPRWHDDDIYAAFRHVVPSFCLPVALRRAAPAGVTSTTIALLWLCLAFGGPIYAQYWALFHEITTWGVAVGWASHRGADGREVSSFVDPGGVRSWLCGLREPAARERHETDASETLYVHAPGGFGASGTFRDNLGPEVWLPMQGRIYTAMLTLSVLLAAATAARVRRLRRTLMRPLRRDQARRDRRGRAGS